MDDLNNIIPKLVFGFIPFLFALCFHEFSHGWVANKLGDPTAKLMGRLTLNPMAHASLVGTIILPLVGMLTGWPVIGWANPVPVNGRNFKKPRTDMFWVALAGPGSNIVLALIGALAVMAIRVFFAHASFAEGGNQFAEGFLIINLWLAFFNLIPIHPLDGGKIFAVFLSDKMNDRLEALQMQSQIILLLLFMTGILMKVIGPMVHMTANLMLLGSAFLFGVA